MYAIVQNGGHQVRMTPGATVLIDRVGGDSGSQVTFEQVLLVEKDGGEVMTGAPFVANAKVLGVVEADVRGPKVRIFKKKRRKGMRRSRGFRHDLTRVKITDVVI